MDTRKEFIYFTLKRQFKKMIKNNISKKTENFAGENFSSEKYEEKKKEFGTIVLESDLDLTPELVFNTYNCRWEIMPISA